MTSITQNSGKNTGTVHVTNLAGSNFQAGATVKLTKSGRADINATGVVVSSTQITCDFNLMSAATEAWNVGVTNSNPDGDGNYMVIWSSVSGATKHTLQEDDNNSVTSPRAVYSGSGSSTAILGRALGTYYYRVNAANAYGPSSWSNIESVVVAASPSGPNPGHWTRSAGGLEFYVTSDRASVDEFAIVVGVTGRGTHEIKHTVLEPIVSNHFSFGGSFYGSGTFSSSTSCEPRGFPTWESLARGEFLGLESSCPRRCWRWQLLDCPLAGLWLVAAYWLMIVSLCLA